MRQPVPLIRQLDLLAQAGEQPAPKLPAETISQLSQLLQQLLLEAIDAERAMREHATGLGWHEVSVIDEDLGGLGAREN